MEQTINNGTKSYGAAQSRVTGSTAPETTEMANSIARSHKRCPSTIFAHRLNFPFPSELSVWSRSRRFRRGVVVEAGADVFFYQTLAAVAAMEHDGKYFTRNFGTDPP